MMKKMKLSEQIIKNAVVFPFGALQGIYNENGDRILGQTQNYKANFKGKIQFIDEKVVFLGFFRAHHGHFITEELARLWWVLQNTAHHKFIYSRLHSKEFSAFERFILDFFNLNERNLIPITKPTKFAQITVPDDSFWNENGIKMHRKMIDFITSKITPVKSQALYLSRRRFDKARSLEFGEEYFEQIYAKKGYKIVYPETLSPSEQLALWGGFKFACVGGTLPHNMIFAPYGSELEIVLKTSFPNGFQSIVDKIKQLKTKRIEAYIELFGVAAGRGPFLFLPQNLTMSKDSLHSTANNIRQYLTEYKKDLAANRLLQKPTQTQLNESFLNFKARIKQVNNELFEVLSQEFKAFERFLRLYFFSPKLAWWFFRVRYFPSIVAKEFRRTLKRVFK